MASYPQQQEDEDDDETKKRKTSDKNNDYLYGILNVHRTASTIEIQNAYKKLTRAVHPDKIQQHQQQQSWLQLDNDKDNNNNKDDAENCFILVKQAHDILMDPIYRFVYNHGGLLAVELIKRSQQVDAAAATRRRRRRQRTEAAASSSRNTTDADSDADGDAQDDDDELNDSDENDNDNDDDYNYYNNNHPNLYKRLEYAKNKQEAIQIIENVLEEYHLQICSSQQTPLQASIDLHQVYHHYHDEEYFDIIMKRLQSEATSSISLSTTQRMSNKQMDCSCSWNGNVDRSGSANFITRFGIGYRPRPVMLAEKDGTGADAEAVSAAAAASTFYAMDISLNHGASYLSVQEQRRQERFQQKQQQQSLQGNHRQQQQQQQQQQRQKQRPPLHYAFQSSRRFHDKTLIQVGVGGSSLTSLQTWSYSLSSSRLVVLGSFFAGNDNVNNDNDEHDIHLHAAWQVAFPLAQPTSVQALAGTIRNLTYPQYKVQLSPLSLVLVNAAGGSSSSSSSNAAAMSSSPALKLTIDSAASQPWHLAIAWHWWLWRIKLTKEQPLSSLLFFWKSTSSAKQRHAAKEQEDEEEKPHHDGWLIKYGFRFDFHEWITLGALGNSRNHWALLLQLRSAANDSWHIRIPIDILQYNTGETTTTTIMPSIVSTWITFMLGQWLEEFIATTFLFQREKYARHKNKTATYLLSTTPRSVYEKATMALLMSPNDTTRSLHRRRHHHRHAMAYPPHYVETIHQIAARKRQLEQEIPNRKGLVILQATIWRSPSSSADGGGCCFYLDEDDHYLQQDDVTDLLQFWVVDSQLPRLYLWNHRSNAALLSRHYHHQQRGEQWWRGDWLYCNNINMKSVVDDDDDNEIRQKSVVQQQLQKKVPLIIQRILGDKNIKDNSALKDNIVQTNSSSNNNEKTVMATVTPAATTAASRIYIRYQHDGKVYEIEFSAPAAHDETMKEDDDDANTTTTTNTNTIWLPHPRAVLMGSASRVR